MMYKICCALFCCFAVGVVLGYQYSPDAMGLLQQRLERAERLLELRHEENLRVMQHISNVKNVIAERYPELADELLKANRLIQLHPEVAAQLRAEGTIE
jgi:hypothetical protein